jgi:hypothetical protein
LAVHVHGFPATNRITRQKSEKTASFRVDWMLAAGFGMLAADKLVLGADFRIPGRNSDR